MIRLVYFGAWMMACASAPPPVVIARAPEPPPPVDVDTEDCRTTTPGRLFARMGSLWFDTRSEGATDETTHGDVDQHAQRSWTDGETLVVPETEVEHTAEASEAVSSVARPSWAPWFGTVVPLADSTFGVAVRSYAARRVAGAGVLPSDALVRIEPRTLTPEVIYASGHRLHMVGRLFGAIIIAELVGEGHQLVAVDANGRVIARSRPVVFPPGAAEDSATELPFRTVAPLDLRRLVITGENDHVFVTEIRGQNITLQDTGVIAPGGFSRRDDGALVLALRNNRCATPGRLPPTRWRLARAQRCSEGERTSHVEGVPVDGAIVSGVRGDAQRCRVRSAVTLPVRGATSESMGAGITVLTDATHGGWEDNHITLDLLVRGRRLDLAFTPTLGADGVTARRGFGVALPPGAVDAREEIVQGVTFWRVRVRAPVPLRPGPTCLSGRWVLRASYDNTEGDQAFANRYHEFGACE